MDNLTAQLIHEAAELKAQIDEMKDKLKGMQVEIVNRVGIPVGKTTTTVDAGSGLKCKITKRETYTWDQPALNKARSVLGDETFLTLFSFKWEGQKRQILNWLNVASDDRRHLIVNAMTVKESTSVAFEREEA